MNNRKLRFQTYLPSDLISHLRGRTKRFSIFDLFVAILTFKPKLRPIRQELGSNNQKDHNILQQKKFFFQKVWKSPMHKQIFKDFFHQQVEFTPPYDLLIKHK